MDSPTQCAVAVAVAVAAALRKNKKNKRSKRLFNRRAKKSVEKKKDGVKVPNTNSQSNITSKSIPSCYPTSLPEELCLAEHSDLTMLDCISKRIYNLSANDDYDETINEQIEEDKIPACRSEPDSANEYNSRTNKKRINVLDAFDGNIDRKKKKKKKSKIVGCKTNQYFFVNINNILSDLDKGTHTVLTQSNCCIGLPSHIHKCLECLNFQPTSEKENEVNKLICRFISFRQILLTKSGDLKYGGFPTPTLNSGSVDIWLPNSRSRYYSEDDVKMSIKIIKDIGPLFNHFYNIETDAWNAASSKKKIHEPITLKRIVKGVREMCDACATSLFNYHWFCGKCGFVVCIDCYDYDGSSETSDKKFSKKNWLLCSDAKIHSPKSLHFAQIIDGNCLEQIEIYVRHIINIFNLDKNGKRTEVEPNDRLNITDESENAGKETKKIDNKSVNNNQQEDVRTKHTPCESDKREYVDTKPRVFAFDSNRWSAVPHVYEGKMLRLLDPKCKENYAIFQEIWSNSNPIIVSNVGSSLTTDLWHPQSFSRDFGNQENDLIDCVTGEVISKQPMSKFWDGFSNVNKRMCNSEGEPMLLKLKDWPPSMDFSIKMPSRFENLMDSLPLKKYTHHEGTLNLASHLPNFFVKPDLGPKMYTAYGFAGNKNEHIGTTNLHLDMTDAVNVMVHVEITKNLKKCDRNWHKKRVIKLIKDAGCDEATMKRIQAGETPGALWHIYHPSDAVTIRKLLSKVDVENKTPVAEFSDPIHDQQHYLDKTLCNRLLLEYGVKGFTFVQFNGDAVFIPAGAPHQVRNLHNCIKIAEDFVSPENIFYTYKMTEEFRCLSDQNTCHEDKLQVKNIVFHSLKDCVSVLLNKLRHIVELTYT